MTSRSLPARCLLSILLLLPLSCSDRSSHGPDSGLGREAGQGDTSEPDRSSSPGAQDAAPADSDGHDDDARAGAGWDTDDGPSDRPSGLPDGNLIADAPDVASAPDGAVPADVVPAVDLAAATETKGAPDGAGLLDGGAPADGGLPLDGAPIAIAAGDSWQLRGTPVVKLVQVAPDCLVALAEKIAYVEAEGDYGYAFDHPRQVHLLCRRQAPVPIDFPAWAPTDDFLLTDVAPGPQDGSVWVAAMRWDAQSLQLQPSLHLVDGLPGTPGLTSFPLGAATFDLDTKAPNDASLGYKPAMGDTLDVLRIASTRQGVGLVSRNASGTPYAERWDFDEGRLKRTYQIPLSRPIAGIRIIMAGGTYDVMGWLSSRFRVHAQMDGNGTLYAGLSSSGYELEAFAHEAALPGPPLAGEINGALLYAFVQALAPDGAVTSRWSTPLGGPADSLFLAMAAQGGRVVVGGSARDLTRNGESDLLVGDVGQPARTIDVKQASGAVQMLALAAETLYVGGSWSWTQNPEGLSIAGGDRFLFAMSDTTPLTDPGNLLGPGTRRSEARTACLPCPEVVCIGGMTDGPDTHAADGDIALLQADGFVDCLASVP
jgi:hypothetical protein